MVEEEITEKTENFLVVNHGSKNSNTKEQGSSSTNKEKTPRIGIMHKTKREEYLYGQGQFLCWKKKKIKSWM